MFSAFDLTKPPPSAQQLSAWRADLANASRGTVVTMCIAATVVSLEVLDAILSGGQSLGVLSVLAIIVGVVAFKVSRGVRAIFAQEQSELKFVPLTPEQILETFLLTTDTRNYATAVLNQKRGLTLAELLLARLYAEELQKLIPTLPEPQLRELARKIGLAVPGVLATSA